MVDPGTGLFPTRRQKCFPWSKQRETDLSIRKEKLSLHYLEGNGISWLCWVYDPEWGPGMLKSRDSYELTGSGEFFKKALHGELEIQKNK
jgi:hypothetical protein